MANGDEIRSVTLTIEQWNDVLTALRCGHWELLDFYEIAESLDNTIQQQLNSNNAT